MKKNRLCKIKVCGLRREADIEYINSVEVDYAGFVFAPSMRQVDLETCKNLRRKLKEGIKPVGVFVNQPVDYVKKAIEVCNLDVVQLHGDESDEYCSKFNVEVWKTIKIKDCHSVEATKKYFSVDRFLFDTYNPILNGGTGEVFNWNYLEGVRKKSFILAGGLNEGNVRQAVKMVSPYCVDVSSGVETDGVKDVKKIRDFVAALEEGMV